MSAAQEIAGVISGESRWCVINADCREVLPLIEKVDHVITDPPYEAEAHTLQRRIRVNDGSSHQRGGVDTRPVRSAPIPFEAMTPDVRTRVGLEFARLASRWVLVFCQVEASPIWAAAVSAGGAKYKRTCIWVKPDGQPQLSGDRPGMGYESICVCHARGRSRWNGGGRVGIFVHNTARFDGVEDHDTPKPLSLMLELVSLFTDPGDVVLDPFAGSGTTGVACLRLGRRFIGIEKDPGYAQTATDRLRAEDRGQDLRSFRAGQLSLLADR